MAASEQRSNAASLTTGPVILQLLTELGRGTEERTALDMATAIIAAGGRALIASSGGRLEQRFRSIGAELITLPFDRRGPLARLKNARLIEALVRAQGVEVIHARTHGAAWAGLRAAQRVGVPFVTTWGAVYPENMLFGRRRNAIMARGDRVIAVSEFIADHIRARYPWVGPMLVIPRGADTERFAAGAVPRTRLIQLTEKWQLGDDPRPIILLPGRLHPGKGQRQAIEAAARVKAARGSEFLLVLAGAGEPAFMAELEALVNKHHLHDVVRITGHCDDMPAAYSLASYVLSSATNPDAVGRAAIEAQAMGRPVIGPAHGGTVETVIEGMTGWLFQPRDVADLTRALLAALGTDEAQRAHMGEAGISRVRVQFSVARMQEATLAVYEGMLGRNVPYRA